jgi:DNA-binding YbaB/EbfC family protein
MNIKKMGQLLAQAQQAQEQMQNEIATLKSTGGAGGGAVTATVDGRKNLVELIIAPEVLEEKDPQLVADLVLAAAAEAGRKIDEEVERRTRAFSSKLGLPPGMGF